MESLAQKKDEIQLFYLGKVLDSILLFLSPKNVVIIKNNQMKNNRLTLIKEKIKMKSFMTEKLEHTYSCPNCGDIVQASGQGALNHHLRACEPSFADFFLTPSNKTHCVKYPMNLYDIILFWNKNPIQAKAYLEDIWAGHYKLSSLRDCIKGKRGKNTENDASWGVIRQAFTKFTEIDVDSLSFGDELKRSNALELSFKLNEDSSISSVSTPAFVPGIKKEEGNVAELSAVYYDLVRANPEMKNLLKDAGFTSFKPRELSEVTL